MDKGKTPSSFMTLVGGWRMHENSTLIGRVTRSSTRGFVGAIKAPEPQLPIFGRFCKAAAQLGNSNVLGVIYNISIEDDELTRQIAAAEQPTLEELADQQFVRQIPVEFEALSIGYQIGEAYFYTLPPQPPLALATIQSLEKDEIESFTRRFEFIPRIMSASTLPVDELLAATLRIAAESRGGIEGERFLLNAGRYCAKLLSQDLARMDSFLRSISMDRQGES
jgi:hypothetical protein